LSPRSTHFDVAQDENAACRLGGPRIVAGDLQPNSRIADRKANTVKKGIIGGRDAGHH
jgi:hypothetical protein